VETEYEQVIRHGTARELLLGGRRQGGRYPLVAAARREACRCEGTRGEGDAFRNDKARNPSAILTDGFEQPSSGYQWYLSAERDVGVNFFRCEYDTVTYPEPADR
jgi:hypothetical protein